jgi:LacI family transcriptional regulator
MRPTLADVARESGMSPPTVSQILNGRGSYRPETRRRVQVAAERLGYRPHAYARAMVQGRFGAYALLLSSEHGSSLIAPGLLEGLDEAMGPRGLRLTVARLPEERLAGDARLPGILAEWLADGLLINWNAAVPAALEALVERHALPAVWINRRLPRDAVHPDDRRGAREAVERLLGLGHRRIAYLDHLDCPRAGCLHYSGTDRWEGYAEAMRAAGLEPRLLAEGVIPFARRAAWDRAWLGRDDRPGAVLCYTQTDCQALLYAMAGLGLEPGRDLSVITFAPARFRELGVAVDTVLVPGHELGRCAAELLDRRIAAGAPQASVALAMPLLPGSSCAPAGG